MVRWVLDSHVLSGEYGRIKGAYKMFIQDGELATPSSLYTQDMRLRHIITPTDSLGNV